MLKNVNKKGWLKVLCLLTLVGCLIYSTYTHEQRVDSLRKNMRDLIHETAKVKKSNKLIKQALLERTDAMMNCNDNYKKLKLGCRKMHSKCLNIIRECDDIISNKKNCRAVHALRRCP
jgi:hypothetical protein